MILNSMAWPVEEVTPEEMAEIEEGFAEIDAGKIKKCSTAGR